MAFTHTHTRYFARLGENLSYAASATASAEIAIDESIDTGQSDKLVALALDQSQIKAVYIVSDKALTLETNDGTTPTDSIVLVADKPVSWVTGDAADCPISADVTALYVTNASGATANLKIRILVDATV